MGTKKTVSKCIRFIMHPPKRSHTLLMESIIGIEEERNEKKNYNNTKRKNRTLCEIERKKEENNTNNIYIYKSHLRYLTVISSINYTKLILKRMDHSINHRLRGKLRLKLFFNTLGHFQ